MKILGIDPGLRVTGFGVIQQEGARLHYVASGTIRIPDGDLPSRLKVILDGVGEIAGRTVGFVGYGASPSRLGAALDPVGSTLPPGPALYGALLTGMANAILDCAGT